MDMATDNKIERFQDPYDIMRILEDRECTPEEIRTALFNAFHHIRTIEHHLGNLIAKMRIDADKLESP